MRFYFILPLCFFVLLINSSAIEPKEQRSYVRNYENVLGTSLEIKLTANGARAADRAEEAALKEIDRLNLILSSYDEKSEFKKWENTFNVPVRVSDELFEVFSLFNKWQLATNGAINPAAETISKLWKSASSNGILPIEEDLNNAIKKVEQVHWLLDNNYKSATHISAAPLALNTFVKSYIINKAADAALEVSGITGVVLNVGGDIVVRGNISEKIDISNPLEDAENANSLSTIVLENKAIATSGNYRRGFKIGDNWYSHIVNPKTAQPSDKVISATVIAEDATTAGALATAMNVLNVNESIELAAKYSGVEYLIIDHLGIETKSTNWDSFAVNLPNNTNLELMPAQTNFELLVNLELALIQGQRIYRPFVAIWIEDEAKKPVKNIAVWYNKDRWLPDMKNWFRVYGADYKLEGGPVHSTTSATRSPGKYTLKWDGLDDNNKPVKNGIYTVNVEVVREHGTYQLITKKINFNNTPQKYTFPANEEVASASFEYRKKAK